MKIIQGFSKFTREEKIQIISKQCNLTNENLSVLNKFLNPDNQTQELLDSLAENTISNFVLPFNVCPNFIINDKPYILPMVIEESSVVAAAGAAAKFWAKYGGFHTKVVDTVKVGQVHFNSSAGRLKLQQLFPKLKEELLQRTNDITANMQKRGGGILDIELKDFSTQMENYFQLFVTFRTGNAMGANFINTCLERMGVILEDFMATQTQLSDSERQVEIVMCILSNYTPECKVVCSVETEIKNFEGVSSYSSYQFVKRFQQAVHIAQIDPYRAVTHNKGIYNGIDALVLASGNDFRAVESCGHAYASKEGQYTSLTNVKVSTDTFTYTLEVPMALGTVGGLTTIHPLAKLSMQMLENPSVEELMMIAASAGLANNFSAVKSLVSTGIQQGHMKLHLSNILVQLSATKAEKENVINYFKGNVVSISEVERYLNQLRVK